VPFRKYSCAVEGGRSGWAAASREVARTAEGARRKNDDHGAKTSRLQTRGGYGEHRGGEEDEGEEDDCARRRHRGAR